MGILARRAGLRRRAQAGLDDVLEALFPARCRHCGAAVEPQAERPRHPASRLRSGKLRRTLAGPWSVALRLLCDLCTASLRPMQSLESLPGRVALVSAFAPTPPLFSLLHAFKYEGIQELAPWFGAYVARAARRRLSPPDLCLVPVPLHAARRRERGFNQSLLLARQVALRLGLPLHEDLLRRGRATPPLARSSHAARHAAVRGAFTRQGPLPAASLRLVLVDDVVTTGATSGAALQALGVAPQRAAVLCLCRAAARPARTQPVL